MPTGMISIKDSIATRMLLIVIGLYILVAIAISMIHIGLEYTNQKKRLLRDFEGIEHAFETGLSRNLWTLDEKAFITLVEGMLKYPIITGLIIHNSDHAAIAVGGFLTEQNKSDKISLQVNLSGFNYERNHSRKDLFMFETFTHQFPIIYNNNGEQNLLGGVTLYSNSSVIYRQMKLQIVMLAVNVLLTMFAFSLVLLWAVNRYVRKPLEILTSAIADISLNNLCSYSIDAKTSRPNEILFLEKSMNSMLSDLHTAVCKQNEAQASWRESEERYRLIMESSPIPIVTYDMQGSVLYINPAFTRVFGWIYEEVLGRKIDYIPEELRSETEVMLNKLKRGERISGFQTQRYDKNKNIIDVDISFGIWKNNSGNPVGSVVILHDITEQKKTIEQLQRAQKFEAIGTLAGGVAHDFNNILSGIVGYSQLAEMNIHNSEEATKDIQQVIKGAQRAAELVQQILTFSRQKETEKHPLKAYLEVKEALKLLRSSIPSTIEIIETIDSRSMILADSIKIHQIVMNLCTNAYHAMMDKGGILKVSLKDIEISEPKSLGDKDIALGKYLLLEVEDTGPGMNRETLEKAFDPYFTTKKAGEGTGLGLAIVKAIIDEHNGFLEVRSSPDKGTHFHIYFPIVKEKTNLQQNKIERNSIFEGNENIIIVDDEEAIRISCKEILESYGYRVYLFKNGIDALKYFKQTPHQFDLIITDMTMPGMTGIELIQKIHDIRQDIPSILCSGFSGLINEEKVIQMGVSKYLMKPILKNDLISAIRELVEKKYPKGNQLQS